MQAVILAGGLGSRLRPFTEVIPKPLLPIGEKSLLEIQISRLKTFGFDEIYLATNYKSDYISNFFGNGARYGVQLHISEEKAPLGTVGPLSLLRDQLTRPFVLMNGDILSTIDFRKFYDFALSVVANLCVAIKRVVTPFAFGQIRCEGDFVARIEEKPNFEIDVLAGIYVMRPEILEVIPDNEYFGMDTLIQNMLAWQQPVAKYDLEEYWLDIGQVPDYKEAQQAYQEHFVGQA